MSVRAGTQGVLLAAERIQAGPLERPHGLQELLVARECALEIEGTDIEQALERHIGIAGAQHRRRAIDALHALFDASERAAIHQIDLVCQQYVRKRYLLKRDRVLVELLLDVSRVHQRPDGTERKIFLELLIDKKSLRHGSGICQPRGLDQNCIEALAALAQLRQNSN